MSEWVKQSIKQELSRRCRQAIKENDARIDDLWIRHYGGRLIVSRNGGVVCGVVYEESWRSCHCVSVASATDIEYVLDTLRRHQLLQDLADV